MQIVLLDDINYNDKTWSALSSSLNKINVKSCELIIVLVRFMVPIHYNPRKKSCLCVIMRSWITVWHEIITGMLWVEYVVDWGVKCADMSIVVMCPLIVLHIFFSDTCIRENITFLLPIFTLFSLAYVHAQFLSSIRNNRTWFSQYRYFVCSTGSKNSLVGT